MANGLTVLAQSTVASSKVCCQEAQQVRMEMGKSRGKQLIQVFIWKMSVKGVCACMCVQSTVMKCVQFLVIHTNILPLKEVLVS